MALDSEPSHVSIALAAARGTRPRSDGIVVVLLRDGAAEGVVHQPIEALDCVALTVAAYSYDAVTIIAVASLRAARAGQIILGADSVRTHLERAGITVVAAIHTPSLHDGVWANLGTDDDPAGVLPAARHHRFGGPPRPWNKLRRSLFGH
ncbi:hypothetical protein [Nocardia sp. NPDC052566]|uniref:hypothetical protein n=1 Tax=Nocardia sp. NPDC052566 TaxID=3364330 RepID=UPI0037C84814